MSASCGMYERFLIKLIQNAGGNPESEKAKYGGSDLGIGEDKFRIFWGCFRDGLQHQFQPTKKRDGKTYYWNISADFEKLPNVICHDTKKFTIEINPWKFAELVHEHYKNNPNLFEQAKSHKPGTILNLEGSQQTDDKSDVIGAAPLPTQSPTSQKPNYQERSLATGHCPQEQ